jgi:hypothetical protein
VAVLAIVAALGVAPAGCGGKDNREKNAPPAATVPKDGPDSGASTLRATLTGLLTDHVYLTGVALTTGLGAGLGSEAFKAAKDTLDDNSMALSTTIGSVYGGDAATRFLALWRAQIGSFVGYTKARAAGDANAANAARRELDGDRHDFGAFIARLNHELPGTVVASALRAHTDDVLATVDVAARRSPRAFERLATAARNMPVTAKVLATNIAIQFPRRFAGAADDRAADLRSRLTSLLESHVYLTGIAVTTGVLAGLHSAAFKAAASTLDRNSVALSQTIESVYGPSAGRQFLALWRAHIGFFIDYTKAQAAGNTVRAQMALAKLDGYRRDFGAFIARANPNLSQEAIAGELEPHIATLAAAIRAAVKRSPRTFDRLHVAADHMKMTADVLAGGIFKQFPDRFTPLG